MWGNLQSPIKFCSCDEHAITTLSQRLISQRESAFASALQTALELEEDEQFDRLSKARSLMESVKALTSMI